GEVVNDFEIDIRLEQRRPHFAHRFADVLFGDAAAPGKGAEDAVEFVGKGVEHKAGNGTPLAGHRLLCACAAGLSPSSGTPGEGWGGGHVFLTSARDPVHYYDSCPESAITAEDSLASHERCEKHRQTQRRNCGGC